MAYLPELRTFGASLWLMLLRLVAPAARYILAGVDDTNPQENHSLPADPGGS